MKSVSMETCRNVVRKLYCSELSYKVFNTRRPRAPLLCLSVCPSVRLSIYMSIYMSICMSICMSVTPAVSVLREVEKQQKFKFGPMYFMRLLLCTFPCDLCFMKIRNKVPINCGRQIGSSLD